MVISTVPRATVFLDSHQLDSSQLRSIQYTVEAAILVPPLQRRHSRRCRSHRCTHVELLSPPWRVPSTAASEDSWICHHIRSVPNRHPSGDQSRRWSHVVTPSLHFLSPLDKSSTNVGTGEQIRSVNLTTRNCSTNHHWVSTQDYRSNTSRAGLEDMAKAFELLKIAEDLPNHNRTFEQSGSVFVDAARRKVFRWENMVLKLRLDVSPPVRRKLFFL